jgi:putative ABC transport system ATP-binding protein
MVATPPPKPPSGTPPVEVRGLGRRVGGRWLWRGITFTLPPGGRLALTGPSGSGKTRLLRCLVGLDEADEGEVRLLGRPLGARPLPEVRARVVYLSQHPAFGEGTVEGALRAVFRLRVHRGRAFDRGRVVAWLDRLGRGDALLSRPVSEISGGERQLAALVRALQLDPEVLLLDEPAASLDAEARDGLESLVDVWRDGHPARAWIWTGHDIERLRARASGEIALAGPGAVADAGGEERLAERTETGAGGSGTTAETGPGPAGGTR